jgi:hypothetical protein
VVARREVALVLVLVAATALLAVVPGLNIPISRLAAYEGDGPEPLYDAEIDAAAIRRAAALVPDDATYFVHAPREVPLLVGNVKAAAQLFFEPALLVHDPELAGWVVSYRTRGGPLLPGALRPLRIHRLAPWFALVEVRR